jgi:hypothetical protein
MAPSVSLNPLAGPRAFVRRCYSQAHPVSWLRWLRVSALAAICAAAALAALVAAQAHAQITLATSRGAIAIARVSDATAQVATADTSVRKSFHTGDVALAGSGAGFSGALTAASQDLVLAAEDNVAGQAGARQIQFDEGLLSTYASEVQQAGTDFSAWGPALAMARLGYASDAAATIGAGLDQLRTDEQQAVQASLGSPWLRPGGFWWLLAAPLCALLLVAAITSYVLREGFHRRLSVQLASAVAMTMLALALIGTFNARDGSRAAAALEALLGPRRVPTSPLPPPSALAYSPWMLAVGVVLCGGALALAFAAYRPRLLEYRFTQ